MIYAATTSKAKFPVKIGQTSGDVHERLRNLQTGCPYPLDSVSAVEAEISDTDVHFLLSPFRTAGEWFQPDPVVFRVVERLESEEFQFVLTQIRGLSAGRLARFMRVTDSGSLGDLAAMVAFSDTILLQSLLLAVKHWPKGTAAQRGDGRTSVITIRFKPSETKALRALADKQDRSLSDFGRLALLGLLKN